MTTVLISGSTTADNDFFKKYYVEKLDAFIAQGCKFIIGGAKGIDLIAQQYLLLACSPDMITIVDKGTQDNRLSKEIHHVNGFPSYPARDAWMTENSDIDLATVNQYAGGGSGTFANIVRRKFGQNVAKGVMKLFRENATPFELN